VLTLWAVQPECSWDQALPDRGAGTAGGSSRAVDRRPPTAEPPSPATIRPPGRFLAALDRLLGDPAMLSPTVERFQREVIEDKRGVDGWSSDGRDGDVCEANGAQAAVPVGVSNGERPQLNELRHAGQTEAAKQFKHDRCALSRSPCDLTDQQAATVAAIPTGGGKVPRAWAMTETVRAIFAPPSPSTASCSIASSLVSPAAS